MIITSLLLGFANIGPSFDCARATIPVERAICANPELAMRDRALSLVYSGVPKVFVLVRRAQRRWLIEERNACLSDVCIGRAYDDRIRELAGSSTFSEYLRHEGYVGSLMVAPVGGGWHVFSAGTASIDARSGNFELAEAAGVVRISAGTGHWRHNEECSLEITQVGQRWRVRQDEGCARVFSGLSLAGMYMTERDWWGRP